MRVFVGRLALFLTFYSVTLGFTSTLTQPGISGTSGFKGLVDQAEREFSSLSNRFSQSLLSNVYYKIPEVFLRLPSSNLAPYFSRALDESQDTYLLCKSLYGLLMLEDRFIPAGLVLGQLRHPEPVVRGQALLLIGLRPKIFSIEDIASLSLQEQDPWVSGLFDWVLTKMKVDGSAIRIDQVKETVTRVLYFQNGQPADRFRFTHMRWDSQSNLPPVATNILAPVIDYEKELVFKTPRKSFGVGSQNIHLGDDCAWFRDGTPVFSIAAGIVRLVLSSPEWGNLVLIEHRTVQGEYFCSLYGHLGENILVSAGDSVRAGTPIGMTGMSYTAENGGYGSHLHFSVAEGRWKKEKYRRGFHVRVTLAGVPVTAKIVGFEKSNVVVQSGEKFYGIPKDEGSLNDQIQWIKGYQPKEDGVKGWYDPFLFIQENR